MADTEGTKNTPAYGSFKTLVSFLNDIREGGHVPLQIDRTLMPKLSGSAITETISSLRFLELVKGDKTVVPTARLEQLAMAADSERKEILEKVVRDSYRFLLEAPNFDIERSSGQQVIDLFRQQGVSGSTLTRAISFFLAAARESGIKVSHNVKAPKPSASANKPKKEKKGDPLKMPDAPVAEQKPDDSEGQALHRFEIPIPGKPSVRVLVPESLDAEDWAMLSQMFGIYVERWKRFPRPASKNCEEEL